MRLRAARLIFTCLSSSTIHFHVDFEELDRGQDDVVIRLWLSSLSLRLGHRLFCNEVSLPPQWKQIILHARHSRQSLFWCMRVHCSSRSSERSIQDEVVGLDSSHSQALSDVLSDGSGSFVVPEEESLALSMAACSGRYRNRFLNFVRIGTVVDDMAESFFKSEIRRRLFVTSLLIVASRVGYFIPLPGFDRRLMPQDYLSFTSGSTDELGDFTSELKLSLFQLGISPQIAASILMQVLCHILPSLVKLRKEGLDGHEKIKGYIWWASLGFAVLEAVIVSFYSLQYSIYAASQRFKHVAFTSFLLVIGAMSMTWISDTISEFGFGHGSSLIICTGILTGYTETLYKMLSNFSGNMISSWPYLFAVIGVFTVVTMWAVLVTEGCRKIKLHYYGFKLASATRNDSPVTEVEPYIPFNINPTGMQPVLTTTYLLAFPSVIASIFKSPFWENIKEILNPTNSVGAEPWIFYAIFAFFVFVFNIFDIANLPKEISDYMAKMGARIPNVKPGRATIEYLTKVQASTRFWGGLLLSILATSSSILDRYLRRINENFSIGFTSVLIIVGSIIELRRSYQAYNVMPTLSKVLRRYGV